MSEQLLPTPNSNDAGSHANRTAGRSNPNSKHHDGVTLTDWLRLTSASSPGSEDSTAPSRPQDSDASDRSSGTQAVPLFSSGGGPGSPGGEMSPRYVLPTPRSSEGDRMARYKQGGHPLSSVVDSLASPCPTLVNDAASPTTAGSGRSSPASFAILNPDGSWSRTSPDSSVQETLVGLPSATFSETWPRWGSMRDGQVFEHPRSAPVTDESASSSLLSTPTGTDATSGGAVSRHASIKADVKSLNVPTPTASDSSERTSDKDRGGPNNPDNYETNHNVSLVMWARKLLPTPRNSDSNGPGQHGTGGPDLRTSLGDHTPQPSEDGNE